MYVFFKDNEIYKEYDVSGGKPSTPSPLGTWNIVSKANWGEGFGGTWMGLNVPGGNMVYMAQMNLGALENPFPKDVFGCTIRKQKN